MPIEEMLSASVNLMLLGMGTVFVILGLLIGCITLMSKFLALEAAVPGVIPAGGEQTSQEHAAGVVAAIQAAVHVYRNAFGPKS